MSNLKQVLSLGPKELIKIPAIKNEKKSYMIIQLIKL